VAVQADESVAEAAVEKKAALRRTASDAMRASLREWNNAGLLGGDMGKLKLETGWRKTPLSHEAVHETVE
jgi:hypothetical protein